MPFLAIIAGAIVLCIVVLPQLWIRRVIQKHNGDRPDFPGTGGELAKHLIETFELQGVGVERTQIGDHYDPATRTVGLTDTTYDGRSLTAVAIAAHEVGHALQHYRGERLLSLRQSLAKLTLWTDRFASIFFLAAPVLAGVARTPTALLIFVGIGVALLGVRVLVHLITLPVEIDASFKKALPVLKEGGYLDENDLPAAREVLKAAAFTYVAGALMSLVNLAQWIRIIR